MTKMMRAARLHKIGEPFQVDTIPVPEVRPTDVLVEVKAAGVVPNLRNVVTNYPKWFPFLPLPALPAIYGLDSAGVVAQVGSQVRADIKPGDRVYVNPGLSCGSCLACRRGDHINCTAYTFQGYFGFGPGLAADLRGLSVWRLRPIPDGPGRQPGEAAGQHQLRARRSLRLSRHLLLGAAQGAVRSRSDGADRRRRPARWGWARSSLRWPWARPGSSRRVATRRCSTSCSNLDPARIVPIALGARPTAEIVMEATGGYGVDALIEALGPNAAVATVLDSFNALRRGGKAINIGGVADPIPLEPFPLMCLQKSYIGSLWFTTAEGQDMAAMAHAGTLEPRGVRARALSARACQRGAGRDRPAQRRIHQRRDHALMRQQGEHHAHPTHRHRP